MDRKAAEKKIADIATSAKEELKGFKILGFMPFYLDYITTQTHIDLCRIRLKIQEVTGGSFDLNDFFDPEKQSKVKPLVDDYCTTGLINRRLLGFALKPFLKMKVRRCSHRQIHALYSKLLEMSDPSFCLAYLTHLSQKDHTILKEG